MENIDNISKQSEFMTYKGKPIVRNKNTIYYGYMQDEYVVVMQILTTKKIDDVEVSDRISIQLLSTNTELSLKERIAKTSEKNGLTEALNLASIWLSREIDS
ncbi:MAG: hypothetical protein RSB96_03880 [Oscillospiraceae bacterium]